MRLLLFVTIVAGAAAAGCQPQARTPVIVTECNSEQAEAQQWVTPTAAGTVHLKVTYVEGICLEVAGHNNTVSLQQCDPSRRTAQSFQLNHSTAGTVHIVHLSTGRCLNLNSKGVVDSWPCRSTTLHPGNQLWRLGASTAAIQAAAGNFAGKCLSACKAPPAPPAPPGPSPSKAVAEISDRTSPHVFQGVWAMSANGAARLLFEYSEPTRSEILDLLFSPGLGTRWQGLKVEIGGDVESSYGSMGSYAHVADNSSWRFDRGDQWWLISEAKKRNPDIPLMALSWGMPGWVGGGKTLSEGGADYHVNYLLGAKAQHNISFDWIGIWNEAPWTAEYILLLRKSLDSAGLEHVKITAADGGTDVIAAAVRSAALADAIGSFGIHAYVLQPVPELSVWGASKPLFNTENDLVDGAMPQWGKTRQPSLNWPLAIINNFLLANGSRLCKACVYIFTCSWQALLQCYVQRFTDGQ